MRNGAATLQRCLDSLFGQTFDEWELIVIDGGSSDGTRELLEENARRIRYWVSEPDRGISHAWNKALAETRGAWICFLGADDRFHNSEVLQRVAGPLRAAEGRYCVAYASVNRVDAFGHVVSTDGRPWMSVRDEFRNRMAIPHQGVFHHRSLFARHGHFDEGYRIGGDYELLLRELADHDALFIPDLVAVDVATGGLSDRPETLIRMLRESHRARWAHGLTRQPDALSFTLFRMSCRAWLTRAFGPRVADSAASVYRIVARKPRRPARQDRSQEQSDPGRPS